MAAQDEGRVPLDSLPLAALKTWIEDWLQLNKDATVIQGPSLGAGAPATTIIGESEIFGATTLHIPKWRGYTWVDRNFTVAEVVFTRFTLPATKTVSGLKFFSTTGINAVDAWDGGIYDATGATKLASSGVVTNPAPSAGLVPLPFTANVILSADTIYTAALIQTANGGAANGYVAVSESNIMLQARGNTIQTWLTGTVNNGGTPYAALPADLTVGAAPAGNSGAGPQLLLTTV